MRRGQAIVELVLGLMLLTPMMLLGLYLMQASNEKLTATRAADEALWDATAFSHHTYASKSFHTPSATASGQTSASARFQPKSRLFVAEKSVAITCTGAGGGVPYTVPSTASFYQDLGGARCSTRLTLEAKWIPNAFLDGDVRRAFDFCETDSCQGFAMLMDDWGLTNEADEDAECEVSMRLTGVCKNRGFFRGGETVYKAHQTGGGTLSNADYILVQRVLNQVPKDLGRIKDYQMSFRGTESSFTEGVHVIEGTPEWHTTEFTGPWQGAYTDRAEDFLGRP